MFVVDVLLQVVFTSALVLAVVTVVVGLGHHWLLFGVDPVKVLFDAGFVDGAKLTLITVEPLRFNLMFCSLVDSQCCLISTEIVANITDLSQRCLDPFVNLLLVFSQSLGILCYKVTLRTGETLG